MPLDTSKLTPEQARQILSQLKNNESIKKPSEDDIRNYLIKEKGLDPYKTEGIINNIRHESAFNPSIQEKDPIKGRGGVGLFQHTGPRRDLLESTVPDFATNWKKQIDFALLEPEGQNYLKQNFQSPQDASRWFTLNFEIPLDKETKAEDRLNTINKNITTNEMVSSMTPEEAKRRLALIKEHNSKKQNKVSEGNKNIPWYLKTSSGDIAHPSPLKMMDLAKVNLSTDQEGIAKYLKGKGYNVSMSPDGKALVDGLEVNPSVIEDALSSAMSGNIPFSNLGDILQLGANSLNWPVTAIPDVVGNLPFGSLGKAALAKAAGTREDIMGGDVTLDTLFDLVLGPGKALAKPASKWAGRKLTKYGTNIGSMDSLKSYSKEKLNKAIDYLAGLNLPSREKPFYDSLLKKQSEVGAQLDKKYAEMGNIPVNEMIDDIRGIANNPSIRIDLEDAAKSKTGNVAQRFEEKAIPDKSISTLNESSIPPYEQWKANLLEQIKLRDRGPNTSYSTNADPASLEEVLGHKIDRALEENAWTPVNFDPKGLNEATLPPNPRYNAITDQYSWKDTDNLGDLIDVGNTKPGVGQSIGVNRGQYYRPPTEEELQLLYQQAQQVGPEMILEHETKRLPAKYLAGQKSAFAKNYESDKFANELDASISDKIRNTLRKADPNPGELDALNEQYFPLSLASGTTEKLYKMANDPMSSGDHLYAHIRPDSMPNVGSSSSLFGGIPKTLGRFSGKKLYNFGNKENMDMQTRVALTALERLLSGQVE